MIRSLVLLGLLAALTLAGFGSAAWAAPTPTVPTPVVQPANPPANPVPAPDPFYGALEITTQTTTQLHCPCIIGTNCCGDIWGNPDHCGAKTDKKGHLICVCQNGGCFQP